MKEMNQLKKENNDLKYRLRTGFICSCGKWVKMTIEDMRKHGITPYYGDKP
jgi:flagellar biosynthesis regulator FlaF